VTLRPSSSLTTPCPTPSSANGAVTIESNARDHQVEHLFHLPFRSRVDHFRGAAKVILDHIRAASKMVTEATSSRRDEVARPDELDGTDPGGSATGLAGTAGGARRSRANRVP